MVVDPTEYRRVMGGFAAGVTVVTAPGPVGMTVSSLASVALEPSLLLVCLEHGTPTLDAIRRDGRFGVNILGAADEEVSNRFAFVDEPFAGVDHRLSSPDGVPLLPGGAGWLVCRVWQRHEAGDHDIVIGEVDECTVGPEDPLLYYRSTYRRLL